VGIIEARQSAGLIRRKIQTHSRAFLKTLHNYLTRQVLISLLMTVAVFTFVLLIGNVLKQILELLMSGQASFGIVAEAVGLLIPFVWGFALPMGLLTATLLVFGRFSADHELTAARASGISLISLATPILLLSLLCCGLSAWINMELGPQCRVAYVNLINQMKGQLGNLQLPEGRFIRDFPGYIFYTEKNDKGKLENVIVLQLDKDETNVSMTITAPTGNLDNDSTNRQIILHLDQPRALTKSGLFWQFREMTLTNPYPSTSSGSAMYHPKITDMTFWQLRDDLADLENKLTMPPPAATNSAETLAQFRVMSKQREDSIEPIRLAMNRQIAFSFACFGFTLVGIPLGIRVHRRETNIGVAIALGLVMLYYSFIIIADSLSTRPEFAPHLIVWLPNLIFQAIGAVLLWRANKGI
jgi:lipopolysaccharide export system permease protein